MFDVDEKRVRAHVPARLAETHDQARLSRAFSIHYNRFQPFQ
jgi:hypothetical protein